MKFKNKIKSILGLGVIALMTISCEDILDQPPVSDISDEVFWQSNEDALLGLAASYHYMQETYRLKHLLWGEYRSDNFIPANQASSFTLNLINNTVTATDADQNTTRWNNLYKLINTSNLAIERIPSIPLYDANLLGEAHALRAFAYFDAARVWGGAPLLTDPVVGLSEDNVRPKTDAADLISDVVIPDMLLAEELITTPTDRFRFSGSSILLFQADVYWYLQDYQKAKEALDKFLALNEAINSPYRLVTSRDAWVNLFLSDPTQNGIESGPELIFSIKYDVLEDGNRASGMWELTTAGAPQVYISPLLENKWIEKFPITEAAWTAKYPDFVPKTMNPLNDTVPLYGDWRYFESRDPFAALGESRIYKYYKDAAPLADDGTDIIIYRYAGVLLLKALVENRLDFGNKQVAVDLINQVRVARQLPTVESEDFTTQEQLENFILDERQLELLAEGERWWDLVNTGKAVEVLGPINGLTPDRLLFPIYFEHLLLNEKLVQTPGYN